MFRVGQKVVCVDDSPTQTHFIKPTGPNVVAGRIYTIRGSELQGRRRCVFLYEIKLRNRIRVDGQGTEIGFRTSRFRPLVERKTDTGMAILKSLLVPGAKVLEDVQ